MCVCVGVYIGVCVGVCACVGVRACVYIYTSSFSYSLLSVNTDVLRKQGMMRFTFATFVCSIMLLDIAIYGVSNGASNVASNGALPRRVCALVSCALHGPAAQYTHTLVAQL